MEGRDSLHRPAPSWVLYPPGTSFVDDVLLHDDDGDDFKLTVMHTTLAVVQMFMH